MKLLAINDCSRFDLFSYLCYDCGINRKEVFMNSITYPLQTKGILKPFAAFGQCALQSQAYAKKYETGLVRANSSTFYGREHWAIYKQEENKVIDLTARQFTKKVPARFETELEYWLDAVCEWLGDSIIYELYESYDMNNPFYFGDCVREEIDPYDFEREQAGLKEIEKSIRRNS